MLMDYSRYIKLVYTRATHFWCFKCVTFCMHTHYTHAESDTFKTPKITTGDIT